MKEARIIGLKAVKVILAAILCFVVFEAGVIVFNFTPAKWYVRFNCLCGRAHFHSGERFLPDALLFREIGQQDLSDGHILIFVQPCKRHGERIIITIYDGREYAVQNGN